MVIQVKRPRAVVFDILGTASKSGFLEKILFPFLKTNLESFVDSHWSDREFKKLYALIMQNALEANKVDQNSPAVVPHEHHSAKASLMTYINYVTENGINSPPVTQLRFKVWFDGYQQSVLRTPIYSDVPAKLKKWYAEGVKNYVFSNTWVNAQKALLKNTNHGDLTGLISGYYDNEFGSLHEAESWRRLAAEIGQNPNDILFLTKSPVEARAAGDAGLAVCLVLTHRHNVKGVSSDDKRRFPYVRTLNDLDWAEGADATVSTMPTPRTGTMPSDFNPEQPIPTTATQSTHAGIVSSSRVSSAAGAQSQGHSRASSAASAHSHHSHHSGAGSRASSAHSAHSAHSGHSRGSRVMSGQGESARASAATQTSSQTGAARRSSASNPSHVPSESQVTGAPTGQVSGASSAANDQVSGGSSQATSGASSPNSGQASPVSGASSTATNTAN